jgi:hypothetical protein
MTDTKSLLMGAIPGIALAVLLVTAVPGSALVGSQVTTDSVGAHGYVTVSVTRDGQEIYRHEDHNVITTAGLDFIRQQIGSSVAAGGSAPASSGANFIALSSNADGASAAHTALAGEITAGGLQRSQGDYAEVSTNQFTITETFAATAGHSDVRLAGLFTGPVVGTPGEGDDDGIMMAENIFTAVTLANGDQLTITWTITLS